jgi:hypothetical protein
MRKLGAYAGLEEISPCVSLRLMRGWKQPQADAWGSLNPERNANYGIGGASNKIGGFLPDTGFT